MASFEDDPSRRAVHLQALVDTMNRAADEEKRMLSSTRRVITRLSIARLMLAARRARRPFIDADLLGEPAWDILLFLYIAYREGRTVEIETAMAAAQTATTVAGRWIGILVHKGLIEPIAATSDDPKQFLYMTDKAVAAMEGAIDNYLKMGDELF
ncbi:hypothetical protein VH567_00990 [Sphingomonas sp. 4RDLI-65]|uniref:hypothetical protein n=1 Tax=Sphingomonas sp. 4RDLI-65 TaxID=3111641 RepID=UPI003C27011A